MQTDLDYVKLMVLFGLLGFAANWLALRQGYYTLPFRTVAEKGMLRFKSVVIVFAIYLAMTTFVSILVIYVVRAIYHLFNVQPPLTTIGWVQLALLAFMFLLFYLYMQTLAPALRSRLIKDRSIANPKPILWDMGLGILTWFISFPLVMAIGQLSDLLLYLFTGFQNYEQVAVRYLKTTLSSPPLLAVALFTILLAAPAIEELLFRGFLQTYLKRFMPIKWAIISSSLCFALFHLAPSQGLGNISLIISLFTFALYLGFIYERQASLFASFALHVTFNSVSTFRILFFAEA